MPSPRLVLDFDGVIADAVQECALVTWLGQHPPDPQRRVSSYLSAMPASFQHAFEQVRLYARTLDEFFVAHRPGAHQLRSRAHFQALFSAVPQRETTRFVARATHARGRCREEEPALWSGLHTLYPGIAEVLHRYAGYVAIVTAKDESSVWAILQHHSLAETVTEVYGECGDKPAAVRDLLRRHRMTPSEITFLDDNLINTQRVAATGVRVRWATWGYHTREDLRDADHAGAPRISLRHLTSLTV